MKDKNRLLFLFREITKRNICAPPPIKERKELSPIMSYAFNEE